MSQIEIQKNATRSYQLSTCVNQCNTESKHLALQKHILLLITGLEVNFNRVHENIKISISYTNIPLEVLISKGQMNEEVFHSF